jgi:predicted transposase YbfD/YdcC
MVFLLTTHFHSFFQLLNPEELQRCFLNWVESVCELTEGEIIPIDGKTLRHSYDTNNDQKAIHMVSAWASKNRLVLGQVKVDKKSNEITAIPSLLKKLKGKVEFEQRYFISSLVLDAKSFAEIIRTHWTIENQLNWVLDVQFHEDDSRIRKENSPENMAIIRQLALSLINQENTVNKSVKSKQNKAAWNDDYLLQILTAIGSFLFDNKIFFS